MQGVGGSTEAQSGVGWEGNATKRMMQGARDMRYTVGWLVGRDEKQETHGRNNTLSKHHEKKREHKHRALSRDGVGGWRRRDGNAVMHTGSGHRACNWRARISIDSK